MGPMLAGLGLGILLTMGHMGSVILPLIGGVRRVVGLLPNSRAVLQSRHPSKILGKRHRKSSLLLSRGSAAADSAAWNLLRGDSVLHNSHGDSTRPSGFHKRNRKSSRAEITPSSFFNFWIHRVGRPLITRRVANASLFLGSPQAQIYPKFYFPAG